MDTFRVRLNCIDDYQAVPTEFDPPVPFAKGASQRTARPKVPVIRAFGATETGQKVCIHIHGAFPYLYIEYRGGLGHDEGRCCAYHNARVEAYISVTSEQRDPQPTCIH
jgi:DNA polymerase zeta